MVESRDDKGRGGGWWGEVNHEMERESYRGFMSRDVFIGRCVWGDGEVS